MKLRTLLLLAALMLCTSISAQTLRDGYVAAGYETNTIYYSDDAKTSAKAPDGRFGSNNYLKVDFGLGNFSGGIQVEGYMPALVGYAAELDGRALTMKYAAFSDEGFTVRVGDFFDQFGSGLLFRAYEERSLGVNTALEGVNIAYNLNDYIAVRGIYARPKLFLEYSDVSRVYGADMSVSLSRIMGFDAFNLYVAGSVFSKHQPLTNDAERNSGITPDVTGYSARLAFDVGTVSLKGEYVTRDADVAAYDGYNTERAKALLVEAAYSYQGLGVNLTYRQLKNMVMQSDRREDRMFTMLNYIPALTQQHSYSLASINPYQAQAVDEYGGQADIYYFFKRNTVLGGSRGMRAHANFSSYYGPINIAALKDKIDVLYFRDLTVDCERWWGKKTKMILLYSWQTYNPLVQGHQSDTWVSHIVVADITRKLSSRHSMRCELQHLSTASDKGNWAAATLEYTVSPAWSISVADMWNYGTTGIHYYNGGISYSHSRTRCSLNFGRFKEGYQCAGGICRLIPAYTGANFTLTTTF